MIIQPMLESMLAPLLISSLLDLTADFIEHTAEAKLCQSLGQLNWLLYQNNNNKTTGWFGMI